MLILTAAHCVKGTLMRLPYHDTNFVIAPGWAKGKRPYGSWAIAHIYINPKWLECPIPMMDCHEDPIYDYAVMIVSPVKKLHIGSVTGANGFILPQPNKLVNIQIVGYVKDDPRPLRSNTATVTVTQNGQLYRGGRALGEGEGSSGGPWIRRLEPKYGIGDLVGDTGGWDQGGPNSGVPSYSSYWDAYFARLVHDAAKKECKKCG
jgi:hypothetical protein